MSRWCSETLSRPAARASVRPRSICALDKSHPTNVARGSDASQGQQITAAGEAQLQNAARRDLRRLHPQQRGDRR